MTSISFVVITGLSGAGKSYAIKCFEDMGFFCVDNLPTTLIPTFADLVAGTAHRIHRVALGVDVREGEYLFHLLDALTELRKRGHRVEVLFLEASEETLVRRYQETRRRHPMARDGGNVTDGIRAEKKAMSHMREVADRIVDTSSLTVHQFKDLLVDAYAAAKDRPGLTVSVVSFGFKHGLPVDAELVFDVRFLPNPHFVEGLRPLDGRDARVRDFVMKHEETTELLTRLQSLLEYVVPAYQREGKAYLTIAIGCTGGRHRSVALAEEIRPFLERLGFSVTLAHRDIDRE